MSEVNSVSPHPGAHHTTSISSTNASTMTTSHLAYVSAPAFPTPISIRSTSIGTSAWVCGTGKGSLGNGLGKRRVKSTTSVSMQQIQFNNPNTNTNPNASNISNMNGMPSSYRRVLENTEKRTVAAAAAAAAAKVDSKNSINPNANANTNGKGNNINKNNASNHSTATTTTSSSASASLTLKEKMAVLDSAIVDIARGGKRNDSREWCDSLMHVLVDHLGDHAHPQDTNISIITLARSLAMISKLSKRGSYIARREVQTFLSFESFASLWNNQGTDIMRQTLEMAEQSILVLDSVKSTVNEREEARSTLASIGKSVAGMMHSMGVLQWCPSDAFLTVWWRLALSTVEFFSDNSLASCAHGMGRVASSPSYRKSQSMVPVNAAALSKEDSGLFSSLSFEGVFWKKWMARFESKELRMDSQQLSMCIWGFSSALTLRDVHNCTNGERRLIHSFIISFCKRFRKADGWCSQGLANSLWGVAKLYRLAKSGPGAAYGNNIGASMSSLTVAASTRTPSTVVAGGAISTKVAPNLQMELDKMFGLWQSLFEEHCPEFRAQELSNCLWACAVLNIAPENPVVERFCGAYSKIMHKSMAIPAVTAKASMHSSDIVCPQGLSNVVWAFATLNISPDASFWKTWQSCAVRNMNSFEPQALAICMWAMATMKMEPEELFLKSWLKTLRTGLNSFSAQEYSTSLWALATLFKNVSPKESILQTDRQDAIETYIRKFVEADSNAFQHEIFAVFLALVESMSTQALSNSLWAVASLKMTPSLALERAWWERFRVLLTEFTPHELATVLWSTAEIHVGKDDSVDTSEMEQEIASLKPLSQQQKKLATKTSLDINMVSSSTTDKKKEGAASAPGKTKKKSSDSFAKPDDSELRGWVDMCLLNFELNYENFDAIALLNSIFALGKLKIWPGDLLLSRWFSAPQKYFECDSLRFADLARLMHACSQLFFVPSQEFVVRLNDWAPRRIKSEASCVEITMLWGALGRLRIKPQAPLLSASLVKLRTLVKEGNCDGQAVSTFFWAMARMGIKPEGSFLTALSEMLEIVVSQMNSLELSNIMWSYAALGLYPSQLLLKRWGARFSQCIAENPDIPAHHMTSSHWALKTLGVSPEPWLPSLLFTELSNDHGNNLKSAKKAEARR